MKEKLNQNDYLDIANLLKKEIEREKENINLFATEYVKSEQEYFNTCKELSIYKVKKYEKILKKIWIETK